MWGGASFGGQYGGGRWGGGGGYTEITFPIEKNDVITFMAAQGGRATPVGVNAPGGWPDGGTGAWGDVSGGGGGGSSRIFVGTTLIAVAGGAGGGAGYAGDGGSGGGLTGVAGASAGGATQTEASYRGGTIGAYDPASNPGADIRNGGGPITYMNRFDRIGGFGGQQNVGTGDDGGGGGGGYYGGSGGGGDGRSGSGGSGFVHPAAIAATTVVGTAAGGDPPGFNDPVYPGNNVARGTASNTQVSGGDGYIWVELT
jgi:hypothetical protein